MTAPRGPRPSRRWRALLPHGVALPEEQWVARHRAILAVLWAHVAGIAVYGLAIGAVHVLLEVVALALPAALAQRTSNARLASCAAAFGLASASAVLVHLSGGVPEMHFHYFIVVALIALYQDVAPFGVVIAYVAIQHGVFGAVAPVSVFQSAPRDDSWFWAAVHALFIAAASAVGIAGWKINENLLLRERRNAVETERIMSGAGEGIIAVDSTGRISRANRTAQEILGVPHPLSEVALEEVFRPLDGNPLDAVLQGGVERDIAAPVALASGRVVKMDYTLAPLTVDGSIDGAVLTFDDVTSREEARVARQELDRVRSAMADQRAEVLALQSAILAPAPVLPGVEIGLAYQAASGPAGGDLYDLLPLPDGTLHVAVVDVGGKGIRATNAALAVIHTVRTLTLEEYALDEVIERTARNVGHQQGPVFATLVVGRYDPAAGTLSVVFGGHPPLVILRADGSTELHHQPGQGIGFPEPGGSSGVVRLEVGAAVVLYTDGLIEGTRDLDAGLARLRRQASARRDLPAPELARHLVDQAIRSARHSDDVLAAVLRRTET